MAHILSLAAGTLPEFQPPDIARAAGETGFRHVGFTIDPAEWTAETKRKTQSVIRDYDLSVLDVEVIWIPKGGTLTDDHRRIVEAGAELGAANILAVSAEPDPARTADAIHQLCLWTAPANMRVALEFLMITAVQSIGAALAVIDKADHPAAAMLVDTIHFQRAGHIAEELASIPERLLPYTQICDGRATCSAGFESYLQDAIDLRSCPGEGDLPVAELIKALPAEIPLSLEIRSEYYRDLFPDPVARAAAVRQASLAYLEKKRIQVR